MREMLQTTQYAEPIGPQTLDAEVAALVETPPTQVVHPDTYLDYPDQMRQIELELSLAIVKHPEHFALMVYDDGSEEPLPATEFTQWFAQGFAPVAGTGHKVHMHDVEHILGYRELFRSRLLALVVIGAAQNALSAGRERMFSHSWDELGDHINCILFGDAWNTTRQNARMHLGWLVDLYVKRVPDDDNCLNKRIYRRLCTELGLQERR